jgi:hypothetical protein
MQSPPHVYKQGDSGIWVIMKDSRPSHGYGLLDLKRIGEVKGYLTMLEKRRWSETVNGIQVWVGVASARRWRGDGHQVMFAARNVGKETVYLPRSIYSGVTSVVAQDENGKQFELRGGGLQLEPHGRMMCQPLEPGRTHYMHWDGFNAMWYKLPEDAPPGTYTVIGTLTNDRTEGQSWGKDPVVRPWCGEVKSYPAVFVPGEGCSERIPSVRWGNK